MGGTSRARRRDAAWNPPSKGGDVTALFAVVVAVPLLLPLLSGLVPLLLVVPALALAAATPRCLSAAARSPRPWMWRIYAAGAASGSAASAVAAASLLDESFTTVAFYLGSGASICLLAGLAPLVRRSLLRSRLERVVDALIFDALVVSLGVWFIGLPGFSGGDPVLTAVFMVDLAALALAAVATLAATARKDRRTGWWLAGGARAPRRPRAQGPPRRMVARRRVHERLRGRWLRRAGRPGGGHGDLLGRGRRGSA